MKCLSVAAYAAALSLACASQAWANPTVLSDSELDTVVAGTSSNHGGDYNKHGRYNRSQNYCEQDNYRKHHKDGGHQKGGGYQNGILNGNNILSGNDVNVLNGNNTAIGVGILGIGAIASR